MRLTFIGCPFKTSYGHYIDALRRAIEARYSDRIQWVASNCGCDDPIERERLFQAKPTAYFEMSHVSAYESSTPWKRVLRRNARNLTYYFRAQRYRRLARDSEVVHFQQTLHAYGAMVAFHWLRGRSRAAKVITLHEIDPDQDKFPHLNTLYNGADAVIVHAGELRDRLMRYGVHAAKIHLLTYGTDLAASPGGADRAGIVFYGGHHLMSGKGIEAVFGAAARLRERLGERAPLIKIHGHYGRETPEEALRLAAQYGVTDRLVWLNQIPEAGIGALYRSAEIAVLPYTGSFAGLAASAAAANGLPVIATRRAGVPEHLGECAVWIDENNPEQLAEAIERLLASPEARSDLAQRAYARAARRLSWPVIAEQTVDLYRDAWQARSARLA
jgi:glycosyltransferase involved in cell wall biosynthesis